MARVTKDVPSGRKKKVKKKRGRSDKSLDISLPTTLNEPPERLDESIIMMHGEKGVGKTSLAAMFKDALVFMFERARRNLKIRQVPKKGEPSLDWERFKGYIELFLKSDSFQTGVIDTIDGCYNACMAAICEKHGVDNPDDYTTPYIIYDEIAAEFGGVLLLIKDSGKGLIFLSHTKPRPMVAKRKGLQRDELDEPEVLNRLEPTCKPAAFRLVQEVADFVFYYGYRDGKRAITVRDPYLVHWVACGVEDRFLDPDGEPIQAFYVGSPAKQAYKDLQSAYANKLRDVDWTPPRKERVRRKRSRRRGSKRR